MGKGSGESHNKLVNEITKMVLEAVQDNGK
jgi:hypothetical protein